MKNGGNGLPPPSNAQRLAERETRPNMPPDWRDWISNFPSIKSVALFCVVAWMATAILLALGGSWGYLYDREPAEGILGLIDRWLDALNWLTAAAVFGVVGKRATEKADVIRAEGEVEAKIVQAQIDVAATQGTPQTAKSVLTRDGMEQAAAVLASASGERARDD